MFFFPMGGMPLEIVGGSTTSAHIAPDFRGAKISFLELAGRQSRGCAFGRRKAVLILRGTFLFCEGKVKSTFDHGSAQSEAGSASPFTNAGIASPAGMIEAIWETVFALATVTAICVGVVRLAGHLNDAQVARNAGIGNGKQFGMTSSGRLSIVGRIGDQRTSQFDGGAQRAELPE
jgi:hypothetical protein